MAKLFVVEDDASLRTELLHVLELQGYDCASAVSFERVVDEIVAYGARSETSRNVWFRRMPGCEDEKPGSHHHAHFVG